MTGKACPVLSRRLPLTLPRGLMGTVVPPALPDTFLCRLASFPPVPVRFGLVAHPPCVRRKFLSSGLRLGEISEVL